MDGKQFKEMALDLIPVITWNESERRRLELMINSIATCEMGSSKELEKRAGRLICSFFSDGIALTPGHKALINLILAYRDCVKYGTAVDFRGKTLEEINFRNEVEKVLCQLGPSSRQRWFGIVEVFICFVEELRRVWKGSHKCAAQAFRVGFGDGGNLSEEESQLQELFVKYRRSVPLGLPEQEQTL